MVKKLEDYKWSSYCMYIGNEKENFICSNIILSYFKGGNRELYKEYVESIMSI